MSATQTKPRQQPEVPNMLLAEEAAAWRAYGEAVLMGAPKAMRTRRFNQALRLLERISEITHPWRER